MDWVARASIEANLKGVSDVSKLGEDRWVSLGLYSI